MIADYLFIMRSKILGRSGGGNMPNRQIGEVG